MRIFGADERGYRSNHFRGAEEMLEAVPATPIEEARARALGHYTAMAEEARLKPIDPAFETNLGHAVLSGELDVSGALTALEQYEAWLASGEPKFGGTTEIAPSVQARIQ